MPIRPPQFNVPILSPAALLRGDDSGGFGSSFEDALSRGMNFFYQTQLQEMAQQGAMERAQLAQEGATERNLQDLQARGFIRAGEAPQVRFPGEEAPRTAETITIAGRQFYDPREVAALQREAQYRQPLGPEQGFLPNQTYRSVFGTEGQPTSAEERAAKRIDPGAQQEFQAFIDSIPDGPEFEPVRKFAQARLNTAAADDYITVAEADQLESAGFTMDSLKNFTERVRELQDMSAERREQMNQMFQEVIEGYQVQDGPDSFRDLTMSEAWEVAFWRTQPERMTDDQFEQITRFVGDNVRSRPDIPDLYEDIASRYQAMGMPSEPEHMGAARYVHTVMQENDELREIIINSPAGGSSSLTAVSKWLSSDEPAAEGMRAALTMQTRSKKEIMQLDAAGQVFPFGLEGRNGLYEMMEYIQPGFNDVPNETGGAGNIPPDRPLTEQEVGQVLSSIREQGWDSDFERLTGQMSPEARRAMRNALVSDTAAQNAESLSRAASQLEEAGEPELAEVFNNLANMARSTGSAFIVARDSIMVPALNR